MSRFVHAKEKSSKCPKTASASFSDQTKEYTEPVAKYVPAEILSAFTILSTTFSTAEAGLNYSSEYWGRWCGYLNQ